MSRARTHIAALAAVLALLGLPPAWAAAGTGGTSAPDQGGTPPGDQSTGASAVTLRASGPAVLRRTVRLTGAVADGRGGQAVTIQVRSAGRRWVAAARTATDEQGRFATGWKANRAGLLAARAVVRPDGDEATASAASDAILLPVYRRTMASVFGRGFYGTRTACGIRLRRTTLGVAHKTLPCGTRVSFLYRGRTIEVPVVDRGPYRRGFTWDLTEAAAKKLRFPYGIDRVGSLALVTARR